MEQNNRPLGWTTLNEARQLIKAGLLVETADMHYWLAEGKEYIYTGKCSDPNGISCWSLGALTQLLPRTIENNYDLLINPEFWVMYRQPLSKEVRFICSSGTSLIENVRDAIIWLLKNKML